MKNNIFIILLSFLFLSCEDVIEVDLEDSDPRLVIDAFFENHYNDEGIFSYTDGAIKLSLSTPFFNDRVPDVSDAIVYITNLNDNSVLNLFDLFEPGVFISENSIQFTPELNTQYELTVIYNNETYIATSELIPTVPIDKIEQRDGTLFEGNETEVFIEFTDDATRRDYYLFNLDFDLFLLTEDTFYQGEKFNFSYFYDETLVNDQNINIQISGVDEDYYNYFNLILEQSDQEGNPFQTTPALFRGNIINTTNNNNFPFGYFRISETYSKNIIIKK